MLQTTELPNSPGFNKSLMDNHTTAWEKFKNLLEVEILNKKY